jgi:hypothetical protein
VQNEQFDERPEGLQVVASLGWAVEVLALSPKTDVFFGFEAK